MSVGKKIAGSLALTLAQQAVDDKTNEIPVALDLLRHMVLEGRIVTTSTSESERCEGRTTSIVQAVTTNRTAARPVASRRARCSVALERPSSTSESSSSALE